MSSMARPILYKDINICAIEVQLYAYLDGPWRSLCALHINVGTLPSVVSYMSLNIMPIITKTMSHYGIKWWGVDCPLNDYGHLLIVSIIEWPVPNFYENQKHNLWWYFIWYKLHTFIVAKFWCWNRLTWTLFLW